MAPPPPPRSQCEAAPGIVQASDGSLFEDVAMDFVAEVQSGERVWVNGSVDEVTLGCKYEVTNGKVTETHIVNKDQLITVNESNLNLAATTELSVAARLEVQQGPRHEFNLGGKIEIMPKHGRIISTSWETKAARKKRLHAKAKETIQSYEATVATTAERASQKIDRDISQLESTIGEMIQSANDYYEKAKTCKCAAGVYSRETKGAEKHKGGTYSIESEGLVSLKGGGGAVLRGGGATVEIKGSKVLLNGTDIAVKK